MGLADNLEQLWSYMLISTDQDLCSPTVCADLPINSLYGEELQIILRYLREKLSSYNYSSLKSVGQGECCHSRITILQRIIKYSRTICSSRVFIHSHHCKEILLDLLDFGTEGALYNQDDNNDISNHNILGPIYYHIHKFRKLNWPAVLNGETEQRVDFSLEDNCIAVVLIREITILHSELLPVHKKEVHKKVEKALLFDGERYLSDVTKFVSTQLEAPISCNIMELWYKLSTFEEKILSALHNILPVESKLDSAHVLAQACNTIVCLSMQIHPKKYWEDVESIVYRLLRQELSLCSKIVSFMDHTIITLMLNQHYRDLAETMVDIVCRSIGTVTDIQTIFESLFLVDALTGHTGAHHAKMLNLIHNRLNRTINSENHSIKEQIGSYAASFINFYHINREIHMLKKLMPHSLLFSCNLFEEQLLLDLFSRMTALRLESTLINPDINKASYIMAELELFEIMTAISKPSFIQLYAYVLIISTGAKDVHQIEAKSKLLYNLSVTSGLSECPAWKNSIFNLTETIAALVQPITSNTIEIGLANTGLPKPVREAICTAKFAIVSIESDNKLKLIREDCLYKISTRLQDKVKTTNYATDCSDKWINDACFYVPVHPEDMNFSLDLTTLSEAKATDNEHSPVTGMNNKETKKLYIMADISWTVKTSRTISVEDLTNICYEHCRGRDAPDVTRDEITNIIQHLIECNMLEWAGKDTVQWSI